MAHLLRKIVDRTRSPFSSSPADSANDESGSSSPGGFIFPKVDPAVDGDDCDHDCASCTIHYPSKFKIDEDDQLYGHVKGWATQILVATGKSDWVRDVEDEEGSVMEALGKGHVKPSNGKLMLSASNMPPPSEYYEGTTGHQPTTVLLLPAFQLIDHVRPQDVPELVQRFINVATTTTTTRLIPDTTTTTITPPDAVQPTTADVEPTPEPVHLTNGDAPKDSITPTLQSRPCPHKYLILLCSQKTRDARCGQSAPLLRRELERQLRPLGLFRDLEDSRPGGVGIYFISHVGGHKYSANMMIYRKGDDGEASQGIWLARVRPEDCEGIVKYTVLQGKVVKPERQLRGGFDRTKGLVSW
ncbi:MAG: hypothetical protein M4579_001014 [Chaenotheca gracillima]|nr:MAG: hypothetical protein M4579_001014 [Chaenotheca gracillima]